MSVNREEHNTRLYISAPSALILGDSTTSDPIPVYDICDPPEPCIEDTYIAIPGDCSSYKRCVNLGEGPKWQIYPCPEANPCFNADPEINRCQKCWYRQCAPECTTGSLISLFRISKHSPSKSFLGISFSYNKIYV